MNENPTYESYYNSLNEIMKLIETNDVSQDQLKKEYSNNLAKIESKFEKLLEELKSADHIVREQYKSAWTSCTQQEGIIRPRDMRPEYCSLDWREAVKDQEKAAAKIREWFAVKAQNAYNEKQKRLKEEEFRRAKLAEEREAEAKRIAEEKRKEEMRQAEELVERLKRKHKK